MIGLVAIFMEGVVVQKHSEVDGRKRIAKRLLLLAALGMSGGCQTIRETRSDRSIAASEPVSRMVAESKVPAGSNPQVGVQQVGFDEWSLAREADLEPVAVRAPSETNAADDQDFTLVIEPQTLRDAMALEATMNEVEPSQDQVSSTLASGSLSEDSPSAGPVQQSGLTLSSVEAMALGTHPRSRKRERGLHFQLDKPSRLVCHSFLCCSISPMRLATNPRRDCTPSSCRNNL